MSFAGSSTSLDFKTKKVSLVKEGGEMDFETDCKGKSWSGLGSLGEFFLCFFVWLIG